MMLSRKAETLRRVLGRSVLPVLAGAALFGLGVLIWAVATQGLASQLVSAAKGDFSLDFIAAEDTTFFHRGPSEGNQIGTAEGQDLGYDDRTSNVDVK